LRLKVILAMFVAVLVVWMVVGTGTGKGPVRSKDPVPAPDISIQTGGKLLRLSDLKGKVVLLDFWATWCGPCRMSIPAIQRMYEKKRNSGFEVMGIALENDDGSQIPGFVQDMGMTYPVGLPTSRQEVAPYSSGSIPLMVLIDRAGKVRWHQEGYSSSVDRELAEQVDKLLSEQ
jgi:cytochrome c biogenesis protein CcmG, thiol:disulfide interchange protein DsbE